MFRHHGFGRTERQNRSLAAYLAAVGGFVNSAGFVLIGSFTSHVTGNVGRLANDLATNEVGAAATAVNMVVAFFAGAFLAAMAVETNVFGRLGNAYAVVLLCEAALFLVFLGASTLTPEAHPRLKDLEAALLCTAMGMQNSLVSRISGAVVRTTHLTGVVTDLGVEAARWFRWWRDTMGEALHVPLSLGRKHTEKPPHAKVALLLTIVGAFSGGGALGAILAVRVAHAAMLVPTLAAVVCAAYAFVTGRAPHRGVDPPPGHRGDA